MSRAAIVLLICGFTLGAPRSIAATALLDQASISGLTEIAALPGFDAQTKPAQPARPGAPTPAAQPTPPPPPAAPSAQAPPPPPPSPPMLGKQVNVQLEFTITDQTGSGAPDKKTVSMIAADGTMGRVRSYAGAQSPRTGGPPVPVSLNVDARPRILSGDGIQIELTIEYRPLPAASQSKPEVETSQLNQSMTVILQNGRPLIVSQAADPVTDRKIVVEAKATVLK
jgi:hypothetical protein